MTRGGCSYCGPGAGKIRRALAESRPDAYFPALAVSLNNLAIFLSRAGKKEEAPDVIRETVEMYRVLAKASSSVISNLADSLNNLSNRLSEAGKPGEALDANEEAVKIPSRRALVAMNPDAFNSALADYLNNLSNKLEKADRQGEALTAIEGAVHTYRALVKTSSEAFSSDLAMALYNLSFRLTDIGRNDEALTRHLLQSRNRQTCFECWLKGSRMLSTDILGTL